VFTTQSNGQVVFAGPLNSNVAKNRNDAHSLQIALCRTGAAQSEHLMAEPNKAFPNDSPTYPQPTMRTRTVIVQGRGLKVESSKKACAEIVLPMESHLALCKSNIQQKGRYEDLSRFHFDCISSFNFSSRRCGLARGKHG